MKIQNSRIKTNLPLALATVLFGAMLFSCGEPKKQDQPAAQAKEKVTPVIPYTLVNTYPHDTTSFTEGFLFHDGKLFESTANNWSTSDGKEDYGYLPQTKSAFGEVNLEKGTYDIKAELDKKLYFGEGIVFLKDKIYQLTYKNQTGFIYDAKTFKKIGQFSYANKEGWGLTTDGKYLIMSDGTYNLTYLDPDTQKEVKVLPVTEGGYGLDHINELEYINGFIYANVWMTNNLVKIDPQSGEVVGKIELDELNVKSREKYLRSLEMNGIAYDPATDRIMITGKLWPYMYEVKFAH